VDTAAVAVAGVVSTAVAVAAGVAIKQFGNFRPGVR